MSILVLGQDMVSYLNLDRHLLDTAQFVRETLGAFELRGYNKLDDNTYPNVHAFITGLNFTETLEYRLQGFYDSLTSHLIWQHYRTRGYRTMFLEDWPLHGSFYRFAKGFRRPPTGYYMRRVIMAMEAPSVFITKEGMKARCLGPTIVFDVGYADKFLRRHLEALHSSDVLNHTLLIFYSDQGTGFGDLRASYIGKFEDSQPFAFVIFPQWFLEQNPEAARSLRVNQFRLTTAFDLHETLIELLD
ncbi:uncharacterized protein [Dermacentor andersoni]|uniref:uncharacterized protein n=1 Tax=Dermacentor andersoni TaxID=34620 RepID=UPI003B3B3B7A